MALAAPPAMSQLPLAIPGVGGKGFFGSCHLKGKLKLSSAFPSCQIHSDSFLEFRGNIMRCDTSINYRTSYIQSIVAFGHHFDPAKRGETPRIGRELRFLNRSLRHIAARSDIARSGTPNAASPFPETSFGPKARGLCFCAVNAVVAIFLFVLMVVSHPFVLLFDRYRRRAHYLVAKWWASLAIMPFFNVEVEGLEHLPTPETPAVYVSNHQSFLDIYTLLTLGRSFKFISKTSIFLYPIIGWAMYLMGVIPLKRMDSRSQLDCLKRCMDLIRRGASVFFFPEGTRSKDGKLGVFKKGAFSVAAKTQVPVVPMTIIGTGSIMPAGQESLLNPGSVKVVIHPCLVGNDAQVLCNQARSVIADTLEHQG